MFNLISQLTTWVLILTIGLGPSINSEAPIRQRRITAPMGQVESNLQDEQVKCLQKFLESYNSPLIEYSEVFIEVADKYSLDWRLLPAISGMESNFGKDILLGSFNPFGWGGGYIYFESWETAIETVGSSLYQKVASQYGSPTPESLGPTYCPPNYHRWILGVRYFMEKIDRTT